MVVQSWADVITSSLQTVWSGFIAFLPNVLGAVIIFIIGWLIAVVLGRLASQVMKALRVDQLLDKMGLRKSLAKANLKLDSAKFVHELVKWFFVVVFLMAATDILRLTQVTDFLKRVLLYIPNLVVAVLILLAAVLIANFLQRLVRASVEAAGLKGAGFLATVTRWSILVFAILAALLQLGVAAALIQTVFTGVIAALVISVGLAFGLGGKEIAAEIIGKIKKEITE